MEIIQDIRNVIVTLDGLTTDNRNGNWDRLIYCRKALIDIMKRLEETNTEGCEQDVILEEDLE